MTDKVQKIREEVKKRYECWKEKESNSHSIESEIRMSECHHLLLILDSLQEELVSEDLEKEIGKVLTDYYGTRYDDETTVELSAFDIVNIAHHFAKWGKNQAKVEIQAQSMALAHGCPKEPVSEDLEEAADKMMPSKYCWSGDGETTLYTREQMKDYFKAGAKWKEKQMMSKAVDAYTL